MSNHVDASVSSKPLENGIVPDHLGDGSTILLACSGDPAKDVVGLRLLRRCGEGNDTGLVVTTSDGSEQTVETYQGLGASPEVPSLRLVDTVSEQQSIAAVYDETPVIFTPAQGDLERLVMALSDLTDPDPPTHGSRHLLVRTLSPILDASSTSQVHSVLERITGLRSDSGLCILGVDYTAHDEETLKRLTDLVDGILWVTQSTSGDVEFDYRPVRAKSSPLLPDGIGDD